MKLISVIATLLVFGVANALSAFSECKAQERFDVMMCKSHTCTDCTLQWCMETCQKIQQDFPTCRCEDWPEARASYSGEGMEHAGKFGDAGDYAKTATGFLSTEIYDDA
mmetsp:Transcript_113887/g.179263  ORF Transcript_113887/g.179263 Transcript_113887/m.179263 type:complete len:109 (+) Transcript_113887:49-375(+)